MKSLKVLTGQDAVELERFLRNHAQSSMELLTCASLAGLEDRGGEQEGTYCACFEGKSMVSVAAHYRNGMVVIQAPMVPGDVVRLASLSSQRRLLGVQGPWSQVQRALVELRIDHALLAANKPETLFSISLERLVVPPLLSSGRVRCRLARDDELGLIAQWRVAWEEELPRPRFFPVEHRPWVLECDGCLVSMADTHKHAQIVQVDGVYTPPELRCRGFARCVVAGSILAMTAEGVQRAILSAGVQLCAVQSLCRALGFVEIGEVGVTLFASPWEFRI